GCELRAASCGQPVCSKLTARSSQPEGCLRGENAALVTSAPMCALIPALFAARWKRGEPYTPSRSSNAIAGIPRFAHTAINSSGVEVPSRKLNAEREWSSTYISCQLPVSSCFYWELTTGNWQLLLVIRSFYEPVST